MRTIKDRIHHALGFEVIGLFIFIPIAMWLFDFDITSIGIAAVVGSIIATVWNYFYNLLFDHSMLKLRGSVYKSIPIRILHALLFEGGLLVILLPMLAWYFNISLWQAFLMDIAMVTFYLVHAFVYNWGYDKVFPIPDK